ncbi:MAG TPA: hypothetical protein VGF02_10960 [Pseudolabrys sp.]
MVDGVEFLRQRADCLRHRRVFRRHAWFQPVKDAPQQRELPVHAHGLQSDAADARPVIGRLVAHDRVLDSVEFVAESLGHVADGVGKLVDNRVEQRHGGRKTLAGLDGALVNLDRIHRRALIGTRSVITKRKRTTASVDWPISCCRSGTTPTISWPSTSSRKCLSGPSSVSRASSDRRALWASHVRQRVSTSDRCTQVQPTWFASACSTASLGMSSAVPSGWK